MKINKLIAVILIGIMLCAAYGLMSKAIDSATTAQQSIVYTDPGRVDVNLSQAELNRAQAALVWQNVQNTREEHDGYAINAGARCVFGNWQTDAEHLCTVAFSVYSVFLMIAAVALFCFGGYIVNRLSKSNHAEV